VKRCECSGQCGAWPGALPAGERFGDLEKQREKVKQITRELEKAKRAVEVARAYAMDVDYKRSLAWRKLREMVDDFNKQASTEVTLLIGDQTYFIYREK